MLNPGSLPQEANRTPQSNPFGWLFYVESTDPTTEEKEAFRFCSFNVPVFFGEDLNGPIEWRPAPFAISPIRQSGEGDLPRVGVTVANVHSDVMRILMQRDFLLEERAQLMFVSAATLGDPKSVVVYDAQVEDVTGNERAVTIRLSGQNLYAIRFPQVTIQGTSCSRTYGGPGCDFPIEELDPGMALLGPCGKLRGDCRDRGELAAAEEHPLAALWPTRWKAFPGVRS